MGSIGFNSVLTYMKHRDREHRFPLDLQAKCPECRKLKKTPHEFFDHGCKVTKRREPVLEKPQPKTIRTNLITSDGDRIILSNKMPALAKTPTKYGDTDVISIHHGKNKTVQTELEATM